MKVRSGFVSNSSSSSFCAFGVSLDWSAIDPVKLALQLKKSNPDEYKELFTINKAYKGDYEEETLDLYEKVLALEEITHDSAIVNLLNDQIYELLYMIDGEGLETIVGEETIWIGKGYNDIPDDMTFGEFRAEAKEAIKGMGLKKLGFEGSFKLEHINETVST